MPITHVTNGVHIPTWLGPPMRELLDRHLGDDWLARATDPATWAPVDAIPDDELWAVRQRPAPAPRRVRARAQRRRPARPAASRATTSRPRRARSTRDVLTIGFARRAGDLQAAATCCCSDPGRALRLIAGDRPVQILLAGKAHPRDDDGKRLVQNLFGVRERAGRRRARRRSWTTTTSASAARLVRGCDVWVNLPRPPLEASGTSGMKSAINGGLQLCVLDGWWAEALRRRQRLGAAPATSTTTTARRTSATPPSSTGCSRTRSCRRSTTAARTASRRAGSRACEASLRTLGPAFGAGRMLRDYEERLYTTRP